MTSPSDDILTKRTRGMLERADCNQRQDYPYNCIFRRAHPCVRRFVRGPDALDRVQNQGAACIQPPRRAGNVQSGPLQASGSSQFRIKRRRKRNAIPDYPYNGSL